MKLCSSAIFVVIYFLAAIVSNDLLFSVSFFSFILTNMKFAHTHMGRRIFQMDLHFYALSKLQAIDIYWIPVE